MVDSPSAVSVPARAAQPLDLVNLRRRLDDLTRLVSDWVWETDAQIRFTSVSERVVELLGWPSRMIQGQRLVDFCVFSEPITLEARLRARLAFRNLPCEICGADGGQRHFLVSGVPVFDQATGAFCGYRGTARDISRRVLAEQTLRRRDAVLQAVGCAASQLLTTADWRRELPRLLAQLGSASCADIVDIFELVVGSDGERRAARRFGGAKHEFFKDSSPSSPSPKSDSPESDGSESDGSESDSLAPVGSARIGEAILRPAMAEWLDPLEAGDVIMLRPADPPGDQQQRPAQTASVLVVPVFAGATL